MRATRTRAKLPDALYIDLWVRDSFTSRYSGKRLFFPAAMRLRSLRDPVAYPYHPNKWVSGEWYHSYPSAEHVELHKDGGADSLDNLITVAWQENLDRGSKDLAKLGWNVREPATDGWDGDFGWFLDEIAADPTLLEHPYLRRWHRAALAWAK
jgi:hypothetical protein